MNYFTRATKRIKSVLHWNKKETNISAKKSEEAGNMNSTEKNDDNGEKSKLNAPLPQDSGENNVNENDLLKRPPRKRKQEIALEYEKSAKKPTAESFQDNIEKYINFDSHSDAFAIKSCKTVGELLQASLKSDGWVG